MIDTKLYFPSKMVPSKLWVIQKALIDRVSKLEEFLQELGRRHVYL